jgi:glycine/D-amino acid oxidase-like deaminating enzyme
VSHGLKPWLTYFCKMQVEYIVIGQGISGTFLSYYLQKEKKSFIVIDNNQPHAASRIAAGIINPVTGRRMVTVWMADEILPFAWKAYHEMGHDLGITAISHKNIIDFFPNPQMRQVFLERIEEGYGYVHSYPEQNHFNPLFNYDFGCGEIRPVYIVHLEILLPAWRRQLKDQQALLEEDFDINQLKIENNKTTYKDIEASTIIFCDGITSAANPFFKQLPFAPNKGEALIVEIPHLPDHNIYKKGIMLMPLATQGHFWVGSNYQWEFENAGTTTEFREKTEQLLKDWLKIPFKTVEHYAGIRPATLERRPFAGIHPLQPNIGILNGMGTKGCSLSPFFARQLTDHLLYKEPIIPEADIKRFSRVLSRSQVE